MFFSSANTPFFHSVNFALLCNLPFCAQPSLATPASVLHLNFSTCNSQGRVLTMYILAQRARSGSAPSNRRRRKMRHQSEGSDQLRQTPPRQTTVSQHDKWIGAEASRTKSLCLKLSFTVHRNVKNAAGQHISTGLPFERRAYLNSTNARRLEKLMGLVKKCDEDIWFQSTRPVQVLFHQQTDYDIFMFLTVPRMKSSRKGCSEMIKEKHPRTDRSAQTAGPFSLGQS